jgi:hypothetical protein
VVAIHERLHQEPALALGDVKGSTDVFGAAAERFLA